MERDLIIELKAALEQVDTYESALKEAKARLDAAKHQLIEHFNATETERTATYEGVGFVTRMKPQLYASCPQEKFEDLKDHLKQSGREDLLKETVHPKTLSTYVGELMEHGQAVPDCVSYYLKDNVRLYIK